jgi:IS30 family transposase
MRVLSREGQKQNSLRFDVGFIPADSIGDQGKEIACHKRFTVATNVQVSFCDPRSPWQRGSNENTNGLLRQYFPRGTDLSRFSQAHLNAIALHLSQRPRKTLGFETPTGRLQALLH